MVIYREKLKENDGYVYILTNKGEVIKFLASGIFQLKSKNLSLFQLANFLQIFGIKENDSYKVISVLPLRIGFLHFKKYPLIYLWVLFLIKNLNIPFLEEKTFSLVYNLDKFVIQNPKNFIHWFSYHLIKNLGFEPELQRCFACQKKLKKEIYFDNYAYLYCKKCRKPAFLKISYQDYLKALKIRNKNKVPPEVPNFLKKIIKVYLIKTKNLI